MFAEVLGWIRAQCWSQVSPSDPTRASSSSAATRCSPPSCCRGSREAFGVELPLRRPVRRADGRAGSGRARRRPERGPAGRRRDPAPREGGPCRCRSPSSGCGSSTSSSPAAPATTSRWPCACSGALDVPAARAAALGRDGARATRRCAPPSRRRRPPRPALVLAPPAAPPCRLSTSGPAGRARDARRPPGSSPRLSCAAVRPRAPARCCAPRLLRLARRRARAAAAPSTTSSADGWSVGVLDARAGGALRRLRAGGRSLAAARRCRCSTPTSPSGSAAGSRAAAGEPSSPTGGAAGRTLPVLELPTDRPRPPRRA